MDVIQEGLIMLVFKILLVKQLEMQTGKQDVSESGSSVLVESLNASIEHSINYLVYSYYCGTKMPSSGRTDKEIKQVNWSQGSLLDMR